jgi:hypothetical protein
MSEKPAHLPDRRNRYFPCLVVTISVGLLLTCMAAAASCLPQLAGRHMPDPLHFDVYGYNSEDFSPALLASRAAAKWPAITVGPVELRYPPAISEAGATFAPPVVIATTSDGSIEYEASLDTPEGAFPFLTLGVIPNPARTTLGQWLDKNLDGWQCLDAAGIFSELSYPDGHTAFIETGAPLPDCFTGVLDLSGFVDSPEHTRIVDLSLSPLARLDLLGYTTPAAGEALVEGLVANMSVQN